MEQRRISPNDLAAALFAHVAAGAKHYGLDTGSLQLEPYFYSTVETTRSFTARDLDHAVHVKLWHSANQTTRDRWLAVHDALESRHNAPRVIDTADLPEVDVVGLGFELGVRKGA